jgi:hypothetical protein
MSQNQLKISQDDKHCDICKKTFKTSSGLWKHKKKCHVEAEVETDFNNDENVIISNLVVTMIKENKEMQMLMMEQMQKMMIEQMQMFAEHSGNHHNTNTINNTANNFNLNIFLNEKCKNAMNMSDFVKSLVITTRDFEETGKLGYVEGISRIMENGLKKLELHERPIHCSDVKRETIYIRENDKWEKDDEQKTRLLEAIKQVGAKNINMIPQWCKEHPGWCDSESKENDKYLKYVYNSMCGGTDEEIRNNYGNIMRHISRVTMVDKKEPITV